MKTLNRIAQLLTAVAMVQLAACSVPLQVPVQTKPQQQPTFIDQLRQLVPSRAQQSAALEPAKAPEAYPQVNWPALGAGDFAQAQPQWLVGPVKDIQVPKVNWPALGAGDFAQTQPQWLVGPVKDIQVARVNWPALGAGDFETIPATLPKVIWPALGAGDFEAAPKP